MKKISSIISSLITHENSWHIQLIRDWSEIMGPLSSKVTLEKIDGSLLMLGVYNSSWMQELYLLTPLIIKTINAKLGDSCVSSVKLRLIARKNPNASKAAQAYPKISSVEPKTLSSQERDALSSIEDDELRQALKKFLDKCHHLRS